MRPGHETSVKGLGHAASVALEPNLRRTTTSTTTSSRSGRRTWTAWRRSAARRRSWKTPSCQLSSRPFKSCIFFNQAAGHASGLGPSACGGLEGAASLLYGRVPGSALRAVRIFSPGRGVHRRGPLGGPAAWLQAKGKSCEVPRFLGPSRGPRASARALLRLPSAGAGGLRPRPLRGRAARRLGSSKVLSMPLSMISIGFKRSCKDL